MQEWVKLKSLQVDEGGRVSISSENLNIVVEYSQYGIREAEILFHIIGQPTHGVVDVSGWERHDVKLFSLFDIKSDKVCNL